MGLPTAPSLATPVTNLLLREHVFCPSFPVGGIVGLTSTERTLRSRGSRCHAYLSIIVFPWYIRGVRTVEPESHQAGFGELRPCRCGCGTLVRELDERGRRREWVRGHYAKMIWRLYAEATAKGLDMMR